MIQTELKPVTVYRSTDTGAPQLTNTAGSLKTVLKACLVEGYGSQASLGWEMKAEDTTSAVFRSKDPKASNTALQIKNTGTSYADPAMLVEPAGLDQAKKVVADADRRFQYWRIPLTSNKWMLIGHSRAFALLVKGSTRSRLFWFGDFPSTAAGDTGNCAMFYTSDGTYDQMSNSSYMAPQVLGANGGTGSTKFVLARSYTGIGMGVVAILSSLCATYQRQSFPDRITNGLSISECYLHELLDYSANRVPLRGLLPGCYWCANDLSSVEDWTDMSNFVGSDDHFVNCGVSDENNDGGNAMLINTTAWRA